MTKEILRKYEYGDALSDSECRELQKFFRDMEEGCELLGCEFRLFRNEVRRGRMAVEAYLEIRKS